MPVTFTVPAQATTNYALIASEVLKKNGNEAPSDQQISSLATHLGEHPQSVRSTASGVEVSFEDRFMSQLQALSRIDSPHARLTLETLAPTTSRNATSSAQPSQPPTMAIPVPPDGLDGMSASLSFEALSSPAPSISVVPPPPPSLSPGKVSQRLMQVMALDPDSRAAPLEQLKVEVANSQLPASIKEAVASIGDTGRVALNTAAIAIRAVPIAPPTVAQVDDSLGDSSSSIVDKRELLQLRGFASANDVCDFHQARVDGGLAPDSAVNWRVTLSSVGTIQRPVFQGIERTPESVEQFGNNIRDLQARLNGQKPPTNDAHGQKIASLMQEHKQENPTKNSEDILQMTFRDPSMTTAEKDYMVAHERFASMTGGLDLLVARAGNLDGYDIKVSTFNAKFAFIIDQTDGDLAQTATALTSLAPNHHEMLVPEGKDGFINCGKTIHDGFNQAIARINEGHAIREGVELVSHEVNLSIQQAAFSNVLKHVCEDTTVAEAIGIPPGMKTEAMADILQQLTSNIVSGNNPTDGVEWLEPEIAQFLTGAVRDELAHTCTAEAVLTAVKTKLTDVAKGALAYPPDGECRLLAEKLEQQTDLSLAELVDGKYEPDQIACPWPVAEFIAHLGGLISEPAFGSEEALATAEIDVPKADHLEFRSTSEYTGDLDQEELDVDFQPAAPIPVRVDWNGTDDVQRYPMSRLTPVQAIKVDSTKPEFGRFADTIAITGTPSRDAALYTHTEDAVNGTYGANTSYFSGFNRSKNNEARVGIQRELKAKIKASIPFNPRIAELDEAIDNTPLVGFSNEQQPYTLDTAQREHAALSTSLSIAINRFIEQNSMPGNLYKVPEDGV